MRYVNRETGDIIPEYVYLKLSITAQNKFVPIKETVTRTEQVIRTESDSMSIGDGIGAGVTLAVLSPILLFDAFFGD